MIMPIVTGTLAEPYKVPTAVSILVKNDPFAMPWIIANATSGASVSETGHIESIVIALTSIAMEIVFSGPIKSHENPETSLPMAVEKLKPANRAAPVLDGSPSE
jgi:hypothetical protein